jgi:hypothetical protein
MLRESFRAATSTPEYLEAATQLYGAEPNIEYADEITKIVDDVQNTTEELKDIMRDYISRMEG